MVFPVDYITRWKLNNKYINYNKKKYIVIWYYNPKAFKTFRFWTKTNVGYSYQNTIKNMIEHFFVQSFVIFIPFMIFNKTKIKLFFPFAFLWNIKQIMLLLLRMNKIRKISQVENLMKDVKRKNESCWKTKCFIIEFLFFLCLR